MSVKSNNKLLGIFIFGIIVLSGVIILLGNNNKEEKIIYRFVNHSNIINATCYKLKIQPRLYVSVVYGELHNNLNVFDDFDEVRASMGFDPSVGFAQMKVSTFLWINKTYADNKLIEKYQNKRDLLRALSNDSTNIFYSAFYLSLIREKLIQKYSCVPSVKMLGSYYSKGIDYGHSNIDSSYSNIVGITAQKFYYTEKLLGRFPRCDKL